MRAYYNEIDPTAAEWIRELIKAGLVTDGEVDERSIEDVIPADLVGFDRCHFFAGIAVWDYALNLAGWPDDRRIWTGSCPCQPFSAAGKGKGFADERHLWPAWFHLIDAYRRSFGHVPTIFGEQVASKDGLTWLDTVQTDLEAIGYATATIDLPAAGVGAPHIRQRLFFVADAANNGHSAADGIREATESPFTTGTNSNGVDADPLDHASNPRRQTEGQHGSGQSLQPTRPIKSGFTNGFWSSAEWVYCNDPGGAKWRPIEPGTFPLATRTPGRMALLRGYGNSISPWAAKAFIESYIAAAGGE